jgi:hypothetical protein
LLQFNQFDAKAERRAALSPEQRKLLLNFSKDGAIVACDWEQKVRLQHG